MKRRGEATKRIEQLVMNEPELDAEDVVWVSQNVMKGIDRQWASHTRVNNGLGSSGIIMTTAGSQSAEQMMLRLKESRG